MSGGPSTTDYYSWWGGYYNDSSLSWAELCESEASNCTGQAEEYRAWYCDYYCEGDTVYCKWGCALIELNCILIPLSRQSLIHATSKTHFVGAKMN